MVVNIGQTKAIVIFLMLFCSACAAHKTEQRRKADWKASFKQAVFMCGLRVFYAQPDTAMKDVSVSINFDIIGNTDVNKLADSLGKAYAYDLIATPYLMPVDGQPISNYFFGIYHSKALDSIAEGQYRTGRQPAGKCAAQHLSTDGGQLGCNNRTSGGVC